MSNPKPLSSLRLAAFAAPSVPMATLGMPLVVFLPEYYSNDLGLSLALVGSVFGLVRLLDIGVDPLVGALMDHTRTPWGRFRPWLVAGGPVIAIGVYMLFMAHKGVGPIYLWAWLIVVYLGLSMGGLAHLAWGSVLNSSYNGRSRTYAWIQGFTVAGLIVVLLLPAGLSQALHVGSAGGVQAMGWLTIGLIPLCFALPLGLVAEPKAPPRTHRAGLADYLAIFGNGTAVRLLTVDQLLGFATNLTGAIAFFYLEQIKGFSKGQAEILLLVYFFSALGGGPLWLWLSRRMGKHRALAVAAALYVVTQSSALIPPVGDLPIMILAMALAGLPYSAGALLIRAMLADVADQERLRTGADRTGLLFSLSLANGKISAAVSVIACFWFLAAIGFNPASGHNSAQSLLGLEGVFAFAPGVLGLAAAVVILGYPLTAQRHAEIRERLAERDALEPPPLAPILTPEPVTLMVAEPH